MEFWQALIIAAIPSVAAVVTAWLGFRDFRLRRKLETSKQFLTLFAAAHGRPADREHVGVGEQIATIHLIADFAEKEPVLRNAARAGLSDLTTWEATSVDAKKALAGLPDTLTDQQRGAAAAQLAVLLGQNASARKKIASAATAALARLK